MNCKEKEIAELLPWYVNNTLSTEEKGKFEKHLKICTACQIKLSDVQEFSNDLVKNSMDLFSEHIIPEQLVLYAEAKHELKKDDLTIIKAHIKECSDCQKELEILKSVNSFLRKNSRINILLMIRNKINDLFPKILIGPALAYLIVLLLLYPAYLGIFKTGKVFEPDVAENNFELFQLDSRSESESINKIKIPNEIEVFSLSFNLPVLNEENIHYDAKILNSNGKKIWEKQDIKSLDAYGTFLIISQCDFFIEDTYKLIINEINTKENRIQQQFVFSFEVIKTNLK